MEMFLKHVGLVGGLAITLCLAVVNPVLASEHAPEQGSETQHTLPVAPDAVDAKMNEARLLSAFFGLDNDLPFRANALCFGASGKDGMPVVLSHTVDPDELEPEQFQVVTSSGEMRTPKCVTLRPAYDPGERRTVLLIGEFGDALDDPPVSVQVVADLLSEGSPSVNFKGAQKQITPLAAGPSLVLAEVVPRNEWADKRRGTDCPGEIQQVVRVTWSGGVSLSNGDEPGDAERQLYGVTVKRGDGSNEVINPAAIAELGDGDNNHFLCLDTADPAVAVSFPGGHLVDPNKDLNPDTRIVVGQIAN